jgi:uncharacterized protein
VLLPDAEGVFRANDWANGFVRGMNLRREDWVVLFDDENHGGSLVPILALAHEHHPDPEMRPYKEPISSERREKLIVGAAAGVMNIYKYFQSYDKPSTTPLVLAGSSTYRRITPKTGRNELCRAVQARNTSIAVAGFTLH